MLTRTRKLVCDTLPLKAVAALLSTVAAVALPVVFHAIGALTGTGSAMGETFLPMHLGVLAAGLLAGPCAGAIVGVLSPVASMLLTGMPAVTVLPFMTVELAGYGLAGGLLAKTQLPEIGKLLLAQLTGRAVRAVAVLVAAYGFGSPVAVSSIWTTVITGLPGLALQWLALPLLVTFLRRAAK